MVDDTRPRLFPVRHGQVINIPLVLPVLVPVPGAFHLAMEPDDDGDRQSWTKLDCGLGLGRSS